MEYDISQIEENERKQKKSKRFRLVIIALAVILPCSIFGTIMYRGYVRTNNAYKEQERSYTQLAMSYVTDDDTEDAKSKNDKYMQKKVDFASLRQKNGDIYAWIMIPNSSVNYPILQSGTDEQEDYWLNHNLDGTYGYPGTIFTERIFGIDFKAFNTVIYGHNMQNQTMFGVLHNMTTKDYFDKHKYVYIYTEDTTRKYEIVCASTISDVHLAIGYNGYNTEQQRQQFIDYLKSNSDVSRNVSTGIYDNYVTLSTCTSSDKNRFVVLAKCVDSSEKQG